MITTTDIHRVIIDIVSDLITKDYEAVQKNDYSKAYSASELKNEVEDYPGSISLFPKEAFDIMRVYKRSDNEYAIDFPLWYDNERSDLTMVCNVKYMDGFIRYAIEGILVQ